jgi:hypothetical protein
MIKIENNEYVEELPDKSKRAANVTVIRFLGIPLYTHKSTTTNINIVKALEIDKVCKIKGFNNEIEN